MKLSLVTQATLDLLEGTQLAVDDIDRIDIGGLILYLKRNLVPVAILPESPIYQLLRKKPRFAAYIREEQSRYDSALGEFLEIQSAWRNSNINPVLIKSPGFFPYTSDNLDVLVSDGTERVAISIIKKLGYAELPHVREPYKRLFRKIHGEPFGFPVHLHTRIAWVNTFLTGEEIVHGCQYIEGSSKFAYPSDNHGLLITMAHWFYEDKELKLRDLYHLAEILKGHIDWENIWVQTANQGWGSEFKLGLLIVRLVNDQLEIGSIKDGLPNLTESQLPYLLYLYLKNQKQRPVTLPLRQSKPVCKILQIRKNIRNRTQPWTVRIKELFLIIWFTLFVKATWLKRHPFYLVAISGLDGSGKTTLAWNLRSVFTEVFGILAKYFWIRVGSSKFLSVIKTPFILLRQGRKKGPNYGTNPASFVASSRSKQALEQQSILRRIWGYVVVFDYITRLWSYMLIAKIKGGIHLIDRYTIDAVVELTTKYHMYGVEKILHLTPQPDFYIFLQADKDNASKRSLTPLQVDYLESSYETYQTYFDKFDLVLCVNSKPEVIAETCGKLVLQAYLADKT